MGTDWRRRIADENDLIGNLRLVWILRNQEMDHQEENEHTLEVAKLHGFWANPEWFYKVTENEKKKQGDSIRIGNVTIVKESDFDRKLQSAMSGDIAARDRDDIADKVRARRGRQPANMRMSEEEALMQDLLEKDQSDDDIQVIIHKPKK